MIRSGVICLLILATGTFLHSCQDEVTSNEEQETAGSGRTRVIHSASSTSELDIAVRDLYDNSLYALEYNTTYGRQYGYYDLTAGMREVKLYLTYTNIAVAGTVFNMENGAKHTLIAHDFESTIEPELMVLRDTLSSPAGDHSFIRFVHLGTDAPPLRIVEEEVQLSLPDIEPFAHTDYFEVQSDTYRFQILDTDSANLLLVAEPVTFLSGNSYTLILSGSLSDATPVPFNLKTYRETSY